MLGAIIGDIVGSTRKQKIANTGTQELLPEGSHFTGNTVMTLAVAEWLMTDPKHQKETLVAWMQRLGCKYPHAGYGKMFRQWLMSDNPQPYNSFGNGSAMRVSPVGLYANSLEEALELARIAASVTHNHPEGIRGAQAIAACVYKKKTSDWAHGEMENIVTKQVGYDLHFDLEEMGEGQKPNGTCGRDVPIAIRAYLKRSGYAAQKVLQWVMSMGEDFTDSGTLAATISSANGIRAVFRREIVDQCRALLPAELLDINDRFEAFLSRPCYQSYRVDRKLFAGEYPGDKHVEAAKTKVNGILHFGVKHFIDLTEEGELCPYNQWLPEGISYQRFPIRDVSAPESLESVHSLIGDIEYLMEQDGYIYLHCWGGVGRTGTIVACYYARKALRNPTLEHALGAMRSDFAKMPKSSYRECPETQEQIDFVRRFVDSCIGKNSLKERTKELTKDRIRGSLMAGAAGDALGYTVEFMSRNSILSRYGAKGITEFELSHEGKALVSDDTQMTLFTANGMLMGVTRGATRGVGGRPENYVDGTYLDWYYTQTGKKKEMLTNDFHYTWLRDLPELAHRRAPGNTCLSACESLFQGEKVHNNSKGCGGIMRVAPMALLMAGYWSRGKGFYDVVSMDEAGAKIAAVTHKHPLAFLPAAMLTHLIYRLIRMDEQEIKTRIAEIALETIGALDNMYKGEYTEDKHYLAELTKRAVTLATGNNSDAENIRRLGEGWTGEEAWAIALYCAVRHVDSVEEAIIAAVNHDGDSDSTGSVCGNIMGAIYGYEAIKRQRLFCPEGKEIEQTLELSNIILALADDLYTCSGIGELAPGTPENRQWYERYCEMKPAGI